MRLLVTGATGFIGRSLIGNLLQNTDYKINVAVRSISSEFPQEVTQYKIEGITSYTNWDDMLDNVECVVHTAARVHVMKDKSMDPLEEFRSVNTAGTLSLAKQASKKGVKRFIYISSIKVNGENTQKDIPFTENDVPAPVDPYAKSKLEAEKGLLSLSSQTEMEVVIIRPPLVYGPGVKGNFASMLYWIKRGVPLPFGSVHNLRSLISLENLVSFIVLCVNRDQTPKAKNQIFLISDGEDVSTPDLIHKIAKAYRVRAWLIPIPVVIMRFIAQAMGKEQVIDRLFGSLQIDNSKAIKITGWRPVMSMEKQLEIMTKF